MLILARFMYRNVCGLETPPSDRCVWWHLCSNSVLYWNWNWSEQEILSQQWCVENYSKDAPSPKKLWSCCSITQLIFYFIYSPLKNISCLCKMLFYLLFLEFYTLLLSMNKYFHITYHKMLVPKGTKKKKKPFVAIFMFEHCWYWVSVYCPLPGLVSITSLNIHRLSRPYFNPWTFQPNNQQWQK